MKISKTGWVLLVLGVVLITFVSLTVASARQVREQALLREELTVAERRVEVLKLEELTQEHDTLKGQLEEVREENRAAREELRSTNNSIEVTELLFRIAVDSNVKIITVSSPGLSDDELMSIPCSAQSLTATAEGEVPDLVAFIAALNGEFPTGVVESAGIEIPEDGEEPPTLRLQMTVYSYQEEDADG